MMECKVQILPDVLLSPRPPLLLSLPPCVASSYEGCLSVARQPEATPLSCERALNARSRFRVSEHYSEGVMCDSVTAGKSLYVFLFGA